MPALRLIAAALFVLATAVYGMTTLSASVPRWMIIYLWAAMTCVVFLFHLWKDGWKGIDKIDVLAMLCFAWAALSLSWSTDWRQGLMEITNISAVLAVFLWVRRFPQWIPEAALVAAIIALILQYIYPEDWGGHGNRNFQTEAMIMALCLSAQTKKFYLLPLWLLTFGISAWHLIEINPSKIEYVVAPGILMWLWYEWRDCFKFRKFAA